jgi:CheY-like chemotaxis protein
MKNKTPLTTPVARILHVEDNQLIAAATKMMFESLNCQIEIAGSMAAAFEKLDESFNLAILDLGLPDGDGLTIAHFIRKYPGAISSVPIVILTAHGDEAQKETAFQMGCNAFLKKPLSTELCEQMLQRFVFEYDETYFMEN